MNQSSAGFGGSGYKKNPSRGHINLLETHSSIGDIGVEPLKTPERMQDGEFAIEDMDGGYTPEWQEPLKKMLL